MKIALAMICKGTAEEAKHLNTCLGHSAKYVDKVFVTLNAPAGETISPSCYNVCKKYGAVVSEYVWGDDFAAARNFNFAQVPAEYDYILWLDADDALRNGDVMIDAIKKNPKDGYSLWYLYDFDEHKRPYIVHHKLRVVRNDGTFTWVGRLHEALTQKRDTSNFLIRGADVLHLSNADHFEAAKERNLRIALKARDEAPDDPRSYYNTGNAYSSCHLFEESMKEFAIFLATTQSDEEKYIGYLRIAQAHWNLGQRYEAIDKLRYAVGLKPMYPDAYTKMGMMLVAQKRYREAILYLGIALQLPHPEYSIIVFNPREYDYEPIRLLAVAHYELNEIEDALKYFELCRLIYPKDKELQELTAKIRESVEKNAAMKEKADALSKLNDDDLLRELDNLLPEEQSHPNITHLRNTRFIKTESSGRDLVIFCSYTIHTWNPEIAAKTGVGGSEEAVIHLARRWAKMGWNVTVYNSCGHKETQEEVIVVPSHDVQRGHLTMAVPDEVAYVTYKPFWMWNYRDKQDVTILWRHPAMAEYDINSTKVLVDMHDVLSTEEFTPRRLERIHSVLVKTQAHADCFPTVPPEKMRVIPNGIQPDHFADANKKVPGLIINTSSSDRSLSAFLDIFEEVKKRVPHATAEWAYGWDIFDQSHGNNKVMMEWKAKMQARIKELGVVERGRLNTEDVAKLYQRAHIFLYPTGFYEIFCISAVKAQLAGAYPVTTDFAALNEVVKWGSVLPSLLTKDTWAKPYQFDFAIGKELQQQFVDEIVDKLGTKPSECPIKAEIIEKYDWDRVAQVCENIFLL